MSELIIYKKLSFHNDFNYQTENTNFKTREFLDKEIENLVRTGEEKNQTQVIGFGSNESRANGSSATSVVLFKPNQTENEFQVL